MQQKVLCEAIPAAGTWLCVCNLPMAGRLPGCPCTSWLSAGLVGILATTGQSQQECCETVKEGGWGEMHHRLPSVLGVTVLFKKNKQKNSKTLIYQFSVWGRRWVVFNFQ